MSWGKYLLDQWAHLAAICIILAFNWIIVWLEPGSALRLSSLLYMAAISLIVIAVYLAAGYFSKRRFYSHLAPAVEQDSLPGEWRGMSQEELLILQLFRSQYMNQHEREDALARNQKDWLEYMALWFHEIKTPISVSRMHYETDGDIDSLAEEMRKIEHFAEQALYVSRLSHFNKDYLIQEIDIQQTIKDAAKQHMKPFLSKKIKLELSLEPFSVLTDRKALLFIVSQIIGNALKYTGDRGMISICIQPAERKLTIRDNGIGIPQEDIPRVFEKGFTGKNGRQMTASTGMGLYLANELAGKLGHKLVCRSEKGQFCSFEIIFPDMRDPYIEKL